MRLAQGTGSRPPASLVDEARHVSSLKRDFENERNLPNRFC